jgi:MFS family permease
MANPTSTPAPVPAPDPPRSRSGRWDFTLLWVSGTISELAYSASLIALPLLVLTVTGSPSQAGLVGFFDALGLLAAGLPAGAIADRYDRRTVMLCCAGVQALLFGLVAAMLWSGIVSLPALVVFALLNGAATAVALATASALVPSLVAPEKVSDAVALNSARTYGGHLLGTALGGLLQSARNALPFLLGGLLHAVAFVLLAFMSRRPAAHRESGRLWSRREFVEGIQWIAGRPFLRLGIVYATLTTFCYTAVYFIVIASAKISGLDSGLVGLMAALVGVGGLLGSLLAPVLLRLLPGSRSIFLVLWLFALTTLGIALLPGSYTPGILLGLAALSAPTANAYFTTHQLLLTPDSHRGRVMSVANICGAGGGMLAPLAAGLAYEFAGRLPSLLGCAALLFVVALSAVLSPVMRRPPRPPAERSDGPGPSDDAAVPDRSTGAVDPA